jgi:hypothetical protein
MSNKKKSQQEHQFIFERKNHQTKKNKSDKKKYAEPKEQSSHIFSTLIKQRTQNKNPLMKKMPFAREKILHQENIVEQENKLNPNLFSLRFTTLNFPAPHSLGPSSFETHIMSLKERIKNHTMSLNEKILKLFSFLYHSPSKIKNKKKLP